MVQVLHHQEDLLPELRKLELSLLLDSGTKALGYLVRLISFIGHEKGVDVEINVFQSTKEYLEGLETSFGE